MINTIKRIMSLEKCIICNKEEIKIGGKYCSRQCLNKAINSRKDYKKQSKKLSESLQKYHNKTLGLYKDFEVSCKICNSIFHVSERVNKFDVSKNYFCGRSCATKFSTLNDNPKETKEVKCIDCGVVVNVNKRASAKKSRCESCNKKNREIYTKLYYQNNPPSNKPKSKKVNYKLITCKGCGIEFLHNKNKFCSKECNKQYKQKHLTVEQKYRNDCAFKFALKDYPDYFDFELIKEYGWYAPTNSKIPNLDGISRDHMISISDGYKLNIPPEVISHPANCQLMQQSKNSKKHSKSSITYEELLKLIESFC